MQQSSKDTETGPPTMVHGSAGATLSKHGTGTINKPNAPQRRDKCPAKHTGAHYQMIEEKHRKEMEVLNSEIQQRKLELEKKLDSDHRHYMQDLKDHLEHLQRQCEEIDLKFKNQRDRLKLENESIEPRIQLILNDMKQSCDHAEEDHQKLLEQMHSEVQARQSALATLSKELAKVEAELGITDGDMADFNKDHAAQKREMAEEVSSIKAKQRDALKQLGLVETEISKNIRKKEKSLNNAISDMTNPLAALENELHEVELDHKHVTQDFFRKIDMVQRMTAAYEDELPKECNKIEYIIKLLQDEIHKMNKKEENQRAEFQKLHEVESKRNRELLEENQATFEYILDDIEDRLSNAKDRFTGMEKARHLVGERMKERQGSLDEIFVKLSRKHDQWLSDEEIKSEERSNFIRSI